MFFICLGGLYCLVGLTRLYCIAGVFLLFGWWGCFFILIIGGAFGLFLGGVNIMIQSYDLMSFICLEISSGTCICLFIMIILSTYIKWNK